MLKRLASSLLLFPLLAACDGAAASPDADVPGIDAAPVLDGDVADSSLADAPDVDAAPLADAAPADGMPGCESLGNAGTLGSDPNLFGDIAYFGGAENVLPPGRYRVSYVDGCMKYSDEQAWTIHAIGGGAYQWFVGKAMGDALVTPPGTVGYLVGSGGFASFEDCVAANAALPAVEFDFAGGPLGVWLADSPVSDNVTGVDGRNPKWALRSIDACPDAGP